LRAQQEILLRARKEDQAWKDAEKNNSKPADIARLVALEDSVFEMVSDTDEIMERRATEFEHNRAFQTGIRFQEQLDKLIASRIAGRNDALQQLEHYRAGLGQLAQKAADEILDAEFEEIKSQLEQSAAPSLALSKEAQQLRTAHGGWQSESRNAQRHGLAAIAHRLPVPSAETERLARAICGDDEKPGTVCPGDCNRRE
jgi:hypothetical protein